MARRYLTNKGLGVHGHVEKSRRERFLTTEQVNEILNSIKESAATFNNDWRRDHCAIFLGYSLGLRVGEACLLERKHFRHLKEDQSILIPTLKQGEKIIFECQNCKKKLRVSSSKAGREYRCPKCDTKGRVSARLTEQGKFVVPEKGPPIIEGQVVDYCLDYLENVMRPDQRWLFETRSKTRGGPPNHISVSYLSRIFGTYAIAAGLSSKYSWHALRHGRGRQLYRYFKDLLVVRDGLRHKGIKTAEIYAHLDPEEEREYRKKLESVALDGLAGLEIQSSKREPKR